MLDPTITVSRQIIGGDETPYTERSTGRRKLAVRSTRPFTPNPAAGLPLRASSAIR